MKKLNIKAFNRLTRNNKTKTEKPKITTEVIGKLKRMETLEDLEIGERGYIVPWAFSNPLRVQEVITRTSAGTSCLPVTRTGEHAYKVNFDECDYEY